MATRSSKSILVVDDDQEILFLVAFVLEQEGYSIQTAADGREALAMVEIAMPDLILLDMKMPVMDGWEFARQFHARYDSLAPIVVLTAAADARRHAEEIGADGWIGKPFDLDVLVNIIRRHLQENRSNPNSLGKGPTINPSKR